MSEKEIIKVFHPMAGVGDALRRALPTLDISDIIIEREPGATLFDLVFNKKVTEDELSQLKEADIIVTATKYLVQVMSDLPRVKWVQTMDTGADALATATRNSKVIPSYVVSRNVSEDVGLVMAEYVLGQIISHERSWHLTRQKQREGIFYKSDEVTLYRSLQQVTVGILGVGALGIQVARALKHFQSKVIGFTRRPKTEADRSPYLDAYWHTGHLDSFLEQCDYIVSLVPSTPDTKGFLGNDVLKDARKQPVLINVGRGDVINEKDILKALECGWISYAILDVFEKEPLPEDSLLWAHPKVLLTPHTSCFANDKCRSEALAKFFVQNYRRYKSGESLLGSVDWKTGY